MRQRLDPLLQRGATCLECVEGDHLGRTRIHQPLDLALGSATGLLAVLEPGTPVVRH
jgi:hypothetical protein